MGNFSAFPTDDPIFVVGAFTLLNPDGLSESPTNITTTENLGIHFEVSLVLYTSMFLFSVICHFKQ